MFQLPVDFRWATMRAPELPGRIDSKAAFARAGDAQLAGRTLIVGRPGTGKTSLAVAIGRAMMFGRDVNGMFATAPALDRARREHRLGRGDAELVQRAFEVPVLVLDELGAEDGASGTLKEVLHERHAAGRQTVIACVLSVGGIKRHYDGGIIRRLFEGALVIACDKEDQPRLKSEVRLIDLRRPWRTEEDVREEPLVPMPPEAATALDAVLAAVGDAPRRDGTPALSPMNVDAAAIAEARMRNVVQATVLLVQEEENQEAGP